MDHVTEFASLGFEFLFCRRELIFELVGVVDQLGVDFGVTF